MDKKIKILFVLPNLIGGGAERVFTYLVNHINRDKFEPHLALGAKRGAYLQDISEDVVIHELEGERARRAIPSLIKLVRNLKPDTVFSTLGMNFASLTGKMFYPRGTRVILREGNSVTAFLEDVARNSPATAAFYRRVYRLLYNRADGIICQSDFMLRDIAENLGVNEKKLHRIHNPVDLEKIDRLLKEEKTEKLFSEDVFNFVTVGKFHYHKGYDILLRAFSKAREKNEKIALTMLGEGEERESLENLRNELGLNEIVKMPGFSQNPYVYIKQADSFISSSRYEGFANVIVESLACGTPVVVTDCPSANREVIREGENGWFAEVENAGSLAETIIKATVEADKLNASEIRADCQSRFSIKQILPKYEELLNP
jgi:glycosyltransferase involved in cell wall biosynthesis